MYCTAIMAAQTKSLSCRQMRHAASTEEPCGEEGLDAHVVRISTDFGQFQARPEQKVLKKGLEGRTIQFQPGDDALFFTEGLPKEARIGRYPKVGFNQHKQWHEG